MYFNSKGGARPIKAFLTKTVIVILLSLYGIFNTIGCSIKDEKSSVTIATTTSVNDSGLLAVLQPIFEKETGIKLKVIAQGTGQAIKTAQNGDADLILIHDRKSEDKFVAEGYGIKRIELMYNYFVLVGSKADTAGVKALAEMTVSNTLKKISEQKVVFVSRGDDSGTNKKERALWTSAAITPKGNWYVSAGKGMGDVLLMTSEKQGYTLTDKATFLSMKDKLDLEIIIDSSAELKNQYTLIDLNSKKLEGINYIGANEFINWITSDKVLKLIADYGIKEYKEALFVVNYKKQ